MAQLRSSWHRPLLLGLISTLLTSLPVKAAERIFITFSPYHRSIRIASLERFAKEGVVDGNLQFYFNVVGVTEAEKKEYRNLLNTQAKIDPIQMSRFLNTEIGEAFLTQIGNLVTIPGGRNGKYALRGALISASLDPKGLTAINFLRQLPTDVQLQGERILERAKLVQALIEATEKFIGTMATLSSAEAKTEPPVNFSQLPDPRQPGPYGVAPKEVWQLHDASRDRHFYVDVFKPQRWKAGQTPVVIFSHGLASRPEDFDSLGEHLASYGFVVALPQHPGSDYQQAQDLFNGLSRQVFERDEFIDRPKDISFVIDELERRNAGEFGGRLNLTSVGVGGHSFGGYGAMAVAGAEIDWQNLNRECHPNNAFPNTALLLQCRALQLPQKNYDFRDPRVQAVAAVNPVNNAIFGRTGLGKVKVPIIIAGGSYDPATPFVLEQVRSFPWLGSETKYFALADGQAHVDFSQLDAGLSNLVDSMGDLTLPSPDLLHSYRNGIMVPFFEFFTAGDKSYEPFMKSSSSYGQYLSTGQDFKLYIVSGTSALALQQELIDFASARGIQAPQ